MLLRQIVQQLQSSCGVQDKIAPSRHPFDAATAACVGSAAASAASSPSRSLSYVKSSFPWQLVSQKLGG